MTSYEAPHCVFFSNFVLLLSVVQIFPNLSVSVTVSLCNPFRIRDKSVIDGFVYFCVYENVSDL